MARPVRPKPSSVVDTRTAESVRLPCVNAPNLSLPVGQYGVELANEYALKQQNLEYIAMMLRELRAMAVKADESALVYFLEMAALEAMEKSDLLEE